MLWLQKSTMGRIALDARAHWLLARAIWLALAVLTMTGCASTKPLDPELLASISSVEIVRSETPELQLHSFETTVAEAYVGFLYSLKPWAIQKAEGTKLRERCRLDDFGYMVVRQFAEQAPKRMPRWANLRVREAPVGGPYVTADAYVLQVHPVNVLLFSYGSKGLTANVSATLTSPGGDELWKSDARYSQSEAGRARELHELEEDDCRLLKEEMLFAARSLAEQLVTALSGRGR